MYLFKQKFSIGSSLWSVSSQHSCLYSGKRISLKESTHNPQTGSVNQWSTIVWTHTQESATDGTPNSQPTSTERIHMSCRRQFP